MLMYVRLRWGFVSVFLHGMYRNEVCGICGNFDGNATNDLTTRGGEDVSGDLDHIIWSVRDTKIGNSWKLFNPDDQNCTNNTPDQVKVLYDEYTRTRGKRGGFAEKMCRDALIQAGLEDCEGFQYTLEMCIADVEAMDIEEMRHEMVCQAIRFAQELCGGRDAELQEPNVKVEVDSNQDIVEKYCNTKGDAPCLYGYWSEWKLNRCTPCSKTCGGGSQRCTYVRVWSGKNCPTKMETKVEAMRCNFQKCDPQNVEGRYGTCIGSGDIHYRTFDDHQDIDYQGCCLHTVSRLCCANCTGDNAWIEPEQPGLGCDLVNFHVKMQPNCRGQLHWTTVGDIIIDVCGYAVILNRDLSWRIMVTTKGPAYTLYSSPGAITLNCEKNTILSVGISGGDLVFVLRYPFSTQYIMRIQLSSGYFRMDLNDMYRNAVCGICGNFDGNPANDLVTRGGQDVTLYPEHFIWSVRDTMIGNSWKLYNPADPDCVPNTPDEVQEKFDTLYGPKGKRAIPDVIDKCNQAFASIRRCAERGEDYNHALQMCIADAGAMGPEFLDEMICLALKYAGDTCVTKPGSIYQALSKLDPVFQRLTDAKIKEACANVDNRKIVPT